MDWHRILRWTGVVILVGFAWVVDPGLGIFATGFTCIIVGLE